MRKAPAYSKVVYNVGILFAHRPCWAHSCPSPGSGTSSPTQQENWLGVASAVCVEPTHRPEAQVQEYGAATCVWPNLMLLLLLCVLGSVPDGALASFPGFPLGLPRLMLP